MLCVALSVAICSPSVSPSADSRNLSILMALPQLILRSHCGCSPTRSAIHRTPMSMHFTRVLVSTNRIWVQALFTAPSTPVSISTIMLSRMPMATTAYCMCICPTTQPGQRCEELYTMAMAMPRLAVSSRARNSQAVQFQPLKATIRMNRTEPIP